MASKLMRVPPPIEDDVADLKMLLLLDKRAGTNRRVGAIRKAIKKLLKEELANA